MPETHMCIYRIKPGTEEAFADILREHWPVLRRLDLVTEDPPMTWRGKGKDSQPMFFDLMTWKDEEAPNRAHELPEVMAVWEKMGTLCESRDVAPAMEFPHVEKIELHG